MPNYASPKNIISFKSSLIFSVAILVFLGTINLVNTNILATEGAIVSQVELSTLNLEKENQDLSIKISELSRLSDLEGHAFTVGFKRSENVVFAPKTNAFALR